MDKQKQKLGRCAYCRRPAATIDHVPPKGLFATPPAEYIKVPSCQPCNGGASKDDEYFRFALTSRIEAGGNAEALKASETVLRSLDRPQARGFTQSLLSTVSSVDLFSPGGIFLKKTGSYDPDFGRLERVAKRVVKGLFFHEFQRRLPLSYDAAVYSADARRMRDRAGAELFIRLAHLTTELAIEELPQVPFGRVPFGTFTILLGRSGWPETMQQQSRNTFGIFT